MDFISQIMPGKCWVFFACFLYIFSAVGRIQSVPREISSSNKRPFVLYYLSSIFSAFVASIGYFTLAWREQIIYYDTSDWLVVLSILLAGATAGFYQFSFTNAHKKEQWLPNLISGIHIVLFILLFGALSWYIGLNAKTYDFPGSRLIITVITFLFLVAAISFDYFDYVKYDEEEACCFDKFKRDTKQ